MNPNRNKVLIGFGVVAIVLIAGIAFWPPKFRTEDASGSIGVVQKHHAPQIAQKDVILGDEKTRDQQSVLYRDYFTDAAKLQALSALAARDAQASNISLAAQELASNLRNQYASRFDAALASIELAAKQNNNVELAHQAEELASRAKASRGEMTLAHMQELNSKLAHLVQMQSRGEAPSLQAVEASLESALASRDEAAASKLQAATAELNSINLASVQMAAQVEYLGHTTEALGSILQSAELASRDLTAASRLNMAESLASRAEALQNAALNNIQMQARSAGEMASALANMQTEIAASRKLGRAAFDQALGSFQQELAAFREEFASKMQSSFQAELAAMTEFAESRQQYSKMSSANLEASMLGSAQMASRVFSRLANTAELAHAAESLGSVLQSQQLASVLQNEEALGVQAAQLASRKQ